VKKANIQAHSPAPDGKSGCFYDVTFALDQAGPVKGMPANKVLPVEEGGAGALLRAAAAAGDNGLVEALLMAGVHLYEADPDGNTALHAAAGNGRADVYKTLMEEADKFPAEKGPPAHAFTKNVRGMRAFDYMVQGHHIRCTRLMRPSAQDEDYISAAKEMKELPELLSAACKGDAEQLRRAVENVSERGEGVDSARTSSGMTALMLACRKGPSSRTPARTSRIRCALCLRMAPMSTQSPRRDASRSPLRPRPATRESCRCCCGRAPRSMRCRQEA